MDQKEKIALNGNREDMEITGGKGVIKRVVPALAGVAQLVKVSSHKPKGQGFDSQSGHMSRLLVWSAVRAHRRSS